MASEGWSSLRARLPLHGDGRYVRCVDGLPQYGHVKIRVFPSPPGSGLLINDQASQVGAIPKAFIPAVEEGLREATRRGIAGGFLVPDIRIDIVDGSYHKTDSSEAAFRIAAGMAFRNAVDSAGAMPDASSGDDTSGVREPRHPKPAPRNSSVAVPEPDDA